MAAPREATYWLLDRSRSYATVSLVLSNKTSSLPAKLLTTGVVTRSMKTNGPEHKRSQIMGVQQPAPKAKARKPTAAEMRALLAAADETYQKSSPGLLPGLLVIATNAHLSTKKLRR